jgi:post-segregation antitoxin (ccd killing protein)
MKVCVVCNNSKPLSEFYKRVDSPDGYRNDCKKCRSANTLKNYYSDQEVHKSKFREYYSQRKNANPNLSAELYAKNREKSLEYSRDYYQANAEERKAKQRLWSKTNRGIANALGRRYKLKKAKATPLWLTPEQIYNMQCTYKVAAQLSETSSQKWHVDHIVPIRGKDVCGLHVPWNLQLLPAKMNMQKGNRI